MATVRLIETAPAKAALHQTGFAVSRIAGNDRYATANAISREGFPIHASTMFITSGANFPDAISAVPAAVALDAPLLLTTPNQLPNSVRT